MSSTVESSSLDPLFGIPLVGTNRDSDVANASSNKVRELPKEDLPSGQSASPIQKSPANNRRRDINNNSNITVKSVETGSRNRVRRRKNATSVDEASRRYQGKTTSTRKGGTKQSKTNGKARAADPHPVNESLRWDFVLDDPDLEAARMELYRENRRRRYAEAAAARRRDSNVGTTVNGLPPISFAVSIDDAR